ncbi:protein RKD1-like [Wolffia australiana]
MSTPGNKGGDEKEETKEEGAAAMTFEEVAKYFYVPITEAAKQLNMGLTQLKKKCRELGIPRWPHRKMKSLRALISNVQDLGRDDGANGELQLRRAITILESERLALERSPGTKLQERTKRLRQACFKANFKKKKQQRPAHPQNPQNSSRPNLH